MVTCTLNLWMMGFLRTECPSFTAMSVFCLYLQGMDHSHSPSRQGGSCPMVFSREQGKRSNENSLFGASKSLLILFFPLLPRGNGSLGIPCGSLSGPARPLEACATEQIQSYSNQHFKRDSKCRIGENNLFNKWNNSKIMLGKWLGWYRKDFW